MLPLHRTLQLNSHHQQPHPSTLLKLCSDQSNTQPLQLNPSDERQEEEAEQAADLDGKKNEELHYDGENNVFVGLDKYEDGHNEHCQKWNQYILEKTVLLGATVAKGQGVIAITWKVHGDVIDNDLPVDINNEYRDTEMWAFVVLTSQPILQKATKMLWSIQKSCCSSSTFGQMTGILKFSS